ncbi:DNA ligase D [Croceicoccus hydrothermalis]|uniref:DNA ligase D n=1 Tax=Croceicoccus hydrothermalis TaxID=2867964 RepID=UPI001EFAEC87|nr:DNA ligase D [Croceicoccus hydrothermalis]
MTEPSDPLADYNAKRDFSRTSEPAGDPGEPGGNRFIVQKHDATRLHWDLRLEIDGVLKSWAVTKGPSPDPEIKRLAVRTEDHPLSYAGFEGTIPDGEYGGGTVMLWDRGTWQPVEGKSADDLGDGHLHFILSGERMKGEWLLVRMKPRKGERRENWLLRKIEDIHAQSGDPLVDRCLTSVSSGRSMAEIAADADPQYYGGATQQAGKTRTRAGRGRDAKPPAFAKPQLATLVDAVPGGNGWMHEIKFDGYRAIVAAAGDRVTIYTRSGKDWTDKFAPLAAHIAALDLPPSLIDGEIVAYGKDGNPDFSALQSVLKRGAGAQGDTDAMSFHAFDLVVSGGEDLTALSNIERKERLEALLRNAEPPVHVADHVIGAGEQLYRTMCDAGQEGIISKRIDAKYRHARSKAWVKVKCTRRQEFVIVGYSASKAKGRPFASLLLAQNEGGELRYKGKVGTGFDADTLDDISARMKRIARKTPPVEVAKTDARGAHWVTPKLVAEIAFAEFTADEKVRHGSFVALREDKDPAQVKPETTEAPPAAEAKIEISSRSRIVFPDSGQTKGQLADYYAAIAPLMLPFAARRPVSLVRCPQGRAKRCFFQKHDSGAFGPHVHAVAIAEKDGGMEDYLYLKDDAGILACVQMGSVEFHGWGSRTDDVEAPDRMIFDLDPDAGMDFAEVRKAASDIRDRLADIGLVSFAMLSGGKGIHVVVPLSPVHGWDAHKDFARRFAEALSLAEPDRFVATMSKAKRKGRIFIDWLRNQRGATAVLPYSARARSGAPVAVPIGWDALKDARDAHPFSIDDADRLLERAEGDSLGGWGFAEQTLPDI